MDSIRWAIGMPILLSFCAWTGVNCSSRRQRVVELRLTNVDLEGSISPHLRNLSFLKAIYLFNNRLGGHLPQKSALELYDNQFEGVMPQEFGRLTNLNKLNLSDNQLSGNFCVEPFPALCIQDKTPVSFFILQIQNLNSGHHFYKGILSEAHRSLISECKVLGKVRHRNLVKIITSYSNPHFKGLVLQFVSNGSLESHLYSDGNESNDGGFCRLELNERVNIAIDVAHGIENLHYDSSVQVMHCNIKTANVLLDEDLTARVTDFRIARLACSNSMHSLSATLALKGSVGYIAPEYGVGGGVNLHKWVRSAFPNRVAEVVESCLWALAVRKCKKTKFIISTLSAIQYYILVCFAQMNPLVTDRL
eukprot:Gb_24722 [translate_table: standard]